MTTTTPTSAPLPCICGYDLRGLPPDGPCPECGRTTTDLSGGIGAAVARWRKRIRVGGGLVAIGWTVWFATVVVRYVRGEVTWFVLPNGIGGPRLEALLPWLLSHASKGDRCLAGSALILTATGLVVMTCIPRELRTWPRRLASWPLRLAAASASILAAWFGMELNVRFADNSGLESLAYHATNGLAHLFVVTTGYADAAQWASAALFLGVTAASGGRAWLGVRVATVATVAAASAYVGWQVGWDWDTKLGRVFPMVDAGLSAAAFVLVVRFGWMSFWSPDRWRVWAGQRCDAAADGV